MPLLHGKKAKTESGFSRNVSTLIREGKPREQALAIAYSLKREKVRGGRPLGGSKVKG